MQVAGESMEVTVPDESKIIILGHPGIQGTYLGGITVSGLGQA